MKAGWTINPRTLVGVDLTSDSKSGTGCLPGACFDATISVTNLFGVVTYFPWYEGFFIRGGGGFSSLSAEVETLGVTISHDVSGVGWIVGTGYALWLGERFNLTFNLDHSRQYYDDDEVDRSRATVGYLGFEWH